MKFVLFTAYVAVSFVLNIWVTRRHENAWWAMIVYFVTAPACLVIFVAAGIWSLPFFWLYPERHAHLIDIKGTDEQKAALNAYRKECAKYGLWRRLLEKLRLRPHVRPEWPDLLAVDAASRDNDQSSQP
jgi:hypothetical protein